MSSPSPSATRRARPEPPLPLEAPVVLTLREVPGVEGTREYVEMLRTLLAAAATEAEPTPLELLERAASHPSSTLALVALGKLSGHRGEAHREASRIASRLARRAFREAEERDVVWTPMLDALSCAGVRYERQVPEEPELRTLEWQADRLNDWIRAQDEPEKLEPLLSFRSPLVLARVAQHAPRLADAQVERLREGVPTSLALNPQLSEAQRAELARWAWARHEEDWTAQEKKDRSWHFEYFQDPRKAGYFLNVLARSGQGLPPEVVVAMRERAREYGSSAKKRDHYLNLLAENLSTPSEMLEEMSETIGEWGLGRLLQHPAATSCVLQKAVGRLGRSGIAKSLFDEGRAERLSEERVLELIELAQGEGEVLRAAGQLRSGTPRIWQRLLEQARETGGETTLLRALALNWKARRHPEIRPLLLGSRDAETLSNLAPIHDPQEYAGILLQLWKADTRECFRFLQRNHPPEGTRLPAALLARMLKSRNAEERLLVISKLGQVERSEEEPEETPLPLQEKRRGR